MGNKIGLGSASVGASIALLVAFGMGALSGELAAPVRVGTVEIVRLGGGRCSVSDFEVSSWIDSAGALALGLEDRTGKRVLETNCSVVNAGLAPVLTHASTCLRSSWRPGSFPDPLAGSPCAQ